MDGCVQIPLVDDEEESLLHHLPAALSFIEGGLTGGAGSGVCDGGASAPKGGQVLVHCQVSLTQAVASCCLMLLAHCHP